MKHSMTAIAVIIAAAGFAAAAEAQSLNSAGLPGGQNMSTGQNPTQSSAPQYNSDLAQQPATGAANWNQPPQAGMQQQPAGGTISQDTVRQAQQQLRSQGLYRGGDDGVVGGSTQQAISQFQRRSGLPVTGSLDEGTLNRLVGPSTQGYGASTSQPQMPTEPTSTPQAYQAPNTGTYNSVGTYNNAAGYNPPANQPAQR